ncbi:hypothetical protein B0J11DRAFT_512282 [Dendryphion nanum]|uniref:Uncharacterized protein n=1 Tax=Dendryphion nanum TaxID=256645 RepID=A0A9P9D1T7_9PLEO|nr:hypothetical protein B0J11DRAFT_512282 [Dendryphion nanum]
MSSTSTSVSSFLYQHSRRNMLEWLYRFEKLANFVLPIFIDVNYQFLYEGGLFEPADRREAHLNSYNFRTVATLRYISLCASGSFRTPCAHGASSIRYKDICFSNFHACLAWEWLPWVQNAGRPFYVEERK